MEKIENQLRNITVTVSFINLAYISVQTGFFEPMLVHGKPVTSLPVNDSQAFLPPSNFGQMFPVLLNNGQVSQRTGNQQLEENAVLFEKAKQYEEENAELLARFQDLKEEMKAKKIDSFEALAEQDKKVFKLLIELARLTQPAPLEGNNIGVFGLTSTGKSTFLNALLGMKVAETGVGETTKEITPYPSTQFTLWDVPGRNDELVYITMQYISFFKGLTKRLILIQSTVKENSSMMKLLDEIDLQYDIVINKFDIVDEDERQGFKDQIQSEIETLNLKKVNKVFFVSAKHPSMFPDWLEMVNYLTHK